MEKKKLKLDEILMEFSINALKKKSKGSNKIPIKEARVSIVNVKLNKELAEYILKELNNNGKIKKNRQFIKLF